MSKEKQIEEKEKIISDICLLYKEYGTCKQCNADLDIDDEPCYFECMANAIINNGYRKQSEGEWIEHEDDWCGNYYTCSACGCDWTTIDGTPLENNMRYCPECGAKMKGGAE